MVRARELPAPKDWLLELTQSVEVNPSVVRLRLTAPGLSRLEYLPGQDMAVAVGVGDASTVRRRYTISGLDREKEIVDIEVVLHGDGPGVAWARSAVAGQQIDAVVPRGKISVAEAAEWHLFIGDDSAVPAVMSMVGALDDGAQAIVLLEVGGPDEERDFAIASGAQLQLDWLHRGARPPGDPEAIALALEGLTIPAGPGHCYIAGEFGMVRALRADLERRGVAGDAISAKPYWRMGRRNAPHGEPVKD
jgi:NADPH-dependent ferric siderophore reductase